MPDKKEVRTGASTQGAARVSRARGCTAHEMECAGGQVTVVIPNYNGMKYLPRCLDSLARQTLKGMKVLVVENGSTDGSREFLQGRPEVSVLYQEENLGFAGGVNAGIRAADTPYVILLNNDTEAFPGFAEALLREIRRSPRIFSVSARMLRIQDPSEIDDAGDLMSLPGWAFQRGQGEKKERYGESCDVFSACAGAAIYRREALLSLGLFDERHFAYLEDLDLSWRAKRAGYWNRYCPAAEVLHYGSATSGSRYNAFKVRLASRNHVWLMYKNQPLWQLLWNAPFLLAGLLVKFLFFRRLGFGAEFLQGTREGLRGLPEMEAPEGGRERALRSLAMEWEMITGTVLYAARLLRKARRRFP